LPRVVPAINVRLGAERVDARDTPRITKAGKEAPMTDYWVSKLFFDLLHDPKLAAEYRADMAAVMDRYEIKPEFRRALLADDVGTLAPLVNAYLLRFYFQFRGMAEADFIARLHALNDPNLLKDQTRKGAAHG
jgi:hypothetical protein